MFFVTSFCSLCLGDNEELKKINNKDSYDEELINKINTCIFDTDWIENDIPIFICSKCYFFINIFYDFKQMCEKNNAVFRGYILQLKHISKNQSKQFVSNKEICDEYKQVQEDFKCTLGNSGTVLEGIIGTLAAFNQKIRGETEMRPGENSAREKKKKQAPEIENGSGSSVRSGAEAGKTTKESSASSSEGSSSDESVVFIGESSKKVDFCDLSSGAESTEDLKEALRSNLPVENVAVKEETVENEGESNNTGSHSEIPIESEKTEPSEPRNENSQSKNGTKRKKSSETGTSADRNCSEDQTPSNESEEEEEAESGQQTEKFEHSEPNYENSRSERSTKRRKKTSLFSGYQHPEIRCSVCREIFSDNLTYEQHMATHPQCSKCRQGFLNWHSLNSHRNLDLCQTLKQKPKKKKNLKNPSFCESCKEYFPTRNDYLKHRSVHIARNLKKFQGTDTNKSAEEK